MKELSIKEFGELCNTIQPSRFLFNSENQCVGHYISPVIWAMDFQTITSNPSLCTICFGDGKRKDQLKFTMVKGVRLSDRKSVIGTTFSIVCRGLSKSSPDNVYTFIAQ